MTWQWLWWERKNEQGKGLRPAWMQVWGFFCPHDNPVENLRRAVYHERKACAGMEISVKNQIDMLIFHTAICAAGVTK